MSPGPGTCHRVTSPELDTRIDDGNNHELCIIFTPVFMMVIVVKSMITSILCSLGIIYLGGGPGLLVCLHRDYIVPSVPVMQRSGHGWRVIAPLQPCHVSCVMYHVSWLMDHIMPGIRARIILHTRPANWAQNIQIKNTHTIAIVCLHVLNSVQECMNVLTKLEFLIDPTFCVPCDQTFYACFCFRRIKRWGGTWPTRTSSSRWSLAAA